jgi:hypothetical protein
VWCLYELLRSSELKKEIDFGIVEGSVNEAQKLTKHQQKVIVSLTGVDPEKAQASSQQDKDQIFDCIRKGCGFASMRARPRMILVFVSGSDHLGGFGAWSPSSTAWALWT